MKLEPPKKTRQLFADTTKSSNKEIKHSETSGVFSTMYKLNLLICTPHEYKDNVTGIPCTYVSLQRERDGRLQLSNSEILVGRILFSYCLLGMV